MNKCLTSLHTHTVDRSLFAFCQSITFSHHLTNSFPFTLTHLSTQSSLSFTSRIHHPLACQTGLISLTHTQSLLLLQCGVYSKGFQKFQLWVRSPKNSKSQLPTTHVIFPETPNITRFRSTSFNSSKPQNFSKIRVKKECLLSRV